MRQFCNNKRPFLFAAGAFLALRASVFGAPACPEPFSADMANGTSRRARLRGDERFNWTEADDGYAVTRASDGRWQYAVRANGRWAPSGMTPRQRGPEGRVLDAATRSETSSAALSSAAETAAGSQATAGATTLATTPASARLLVILVSFADISITSSTATWTNTFFGASGKTVNTYFKQASKNRFTFIPAEETQGTVNDGIVSVTLSSNHPNEGSATSSGTRTAVRAALIAADDYVDYASYDTNGDGYLAKSELHLVLVFAGYENSFSYSYTPLLWAHHWSLSYPVSAAWLDGVWVADSSCGSYAAVGEYHASANSAKHAATIGVICHELGHDLGLPDLYDTDYSSDGVGTHCLMGYGNWGRAAIGDSYLGQTPVLPCAYCRQILGFSDVQTASGNGTVYTLLQASDSTNLADIVRFDTPDDNQYFLVENRRLSGFDTGLWYYTRSATGGGLAVWHVDTSASANTDDARRLVDLEEAASACLDTYGDPLGSIANYYYSGNVTRFDATTFPSNTLNGGGTGLACVYNVSASGATMTFTGDTGVSLPEAILTMNTPTLSFDWTGGTNRIALFNTGNTSLFWQASSPVWCPVTPADGALSAGATQWVAVACATNASPASSRSGSLAVTATNAFGTAATGSPTNAPITQAAPPTVPWIGTALIVQ